MAQINELQKSFEMIINLNQFPGNQNPSLIPNLWARLNAEKSYDQKTGQKIDFTGVKIVWVELKSYEPVGLTSSTQGI